MSLVGSQQKVFLRLIAALRPHWRRDPGLPTRIQELFATNRSFGSRDRRLYRELIYTTLRFLPWVEPLLDSDPTRATQRVAWLAADLPATRAFRAASCVDWPASPATVAAKAAHLGTKTEDLLPDWVGRHCAEAIASPDLDALHTRAVLWLRLQNPADARTLDEFTAQGWQWKRSAILPGAVQLLAEADVTKTTAFQQGWFEVQDLGSQLILATAGIAPGGRWLDACAGAGGKTLQLATLLGPGGAIDAHDVRPQALRELTIRATRAQVKNIRVLESDPTATYDGVLVDAPCSGSGTWRRSPHLKWTTTPAQIAAAGEKQRELLARFAAFVRPGGQLIYATCSLSRMENEEVSAAFLAANPGFEPVPPANTFNAKVRPVGLAILPAQHNTDGFYVASFRRKA
ncbi:MAG TPA: RsmB/NOP family class I SAM-dependent RNA methyltransferase [Opitutaceae bacterium]|nr:RsmB/NOP family class I SAM-dependent RNA methyltransferase [Opitutaceae bacterium]